MTLLKNMETTADDASETQSQTQNDLLWDHTGDVESDPLLGREAERQSGGNRPTLHLSPEQARDLLRVLDNTRFVLEAFLAQNQDSFGDSGREEGWRWRGGRRSWWAFHCFPHRRRSIAKYIFVITLLLQAVNLSVVSLIDGIPRWDHSAVYGTGITMILVQLVNLLFIIMVSVRLLRQLYKHRVSLLLLAQSYVSTLLLFAGIYTLIYRLEPKSWKFIQEDVGDDPVLVIELYSKFLFFSVSTATLCGSDNVLPKYWYSCVFAAIQMLMSFIYFASILGQTLSQDTQYWLGVGPKTSSDLPRHASAATSDDTRGLYSSSAGSAGRAGSLAGGDPSSQRNQNYGSGGHTVVVSFEDRTGGGGGGEGGERVERCPEHAVAVVDLAGDSIRSASNRSPFPL